jgi:hypothetical protein
MPVDLGSFPTGDPGRLSCAQVASELPAMVDGSGPVLAGAREHARTCLRCQAELARYRILLRSLRSLRGERVRPAPAAVMAALAAIEATELARPGWHVALYLGGGLVAAATGAAGVALWASRRRPALAR